jgi:uncharacterized membrane protein
MEARDRWTILVHYYRAMVGRADVWRMRMDTTTNWSIGATAAVASFVLGNAAAPHYVVFVACLLTLSFLLLEARRLTFYHLWQQRVLLLEERLIRPAMASGTVESDSKPGLEELFDAHLGRTVPSMPVLTAASRRLRRIYLYLFAVQLAVWSMKISSQPAPVSSVRELVGRADTGSVPGEAFFALWGIGFGVAIAMAIARGRVSRDGRVGARAPGAAVPE